MINSDNFITNLMFVLRLVKKKKKKPGNLSRIPNKYCWQGVVANYWFSSVNFSGEKKELFFSEISLPRTSAHRENMEKLKKEFEGKLLCLVSYSSSSFWFFGSRHLTYVCDLLRLICLHIFFLNYRKVLQADVMFRDKKGKNGNILHLIF